MGKTVTYYFLTEIIKAFLFGVFIFISLILMLQFLQLTELILIHNVPINEIVLILFHMGVSFLPTIFPMSLLFSILLTYTRLSGDSEIIAFQAAGYSPVTLILPAVLFSLVVFVISYQTLDVIGPISRNKFDETMKTIGGQKIISGIEEKTFTENLFDFTLYFNERINENELKDLFIKDNRDAKHPRIIVSKTGRIETGKDENSQVLKIHLFNGRAVEESASNTAVYFDKYTLDLVSPIEKLKEDRDANTYVNAEIRRLLSDDSTIAGKKLELSVELHRRLSIAFACLLFGVLGATLGLSTDRRSSASKGFILSVICLTVYWVLVALSTTLATSPFIMSAYMLWLPNFVFLIFTGITFYRATTFR
jgi:lipopolysaccharide export system permease protein